MHTLREFASSSNGDRWFLATDIGSGEPFVLHRGNPSSGGHETRSTVHAFLNMRPFGPEREALIAHLGVADDRGNGNQASYSSSSL